MATSREVTVSANDPSGLPLFGDAGDEDPSVRSFYTRLIKNAAALAPSDDTTPSVLIETDRRNITVKEYDGMAVSVSQKSRQF